ncbi:cysteine hydrolase family protein [Actinomycetospora termitidis]|uniref:Cysteine hydrolase family protein n=1 Tax=Actinomycetospora termitidis TaxID=3053470 RepID=A0ABT7MAF8_9PSEU|nr:cysteine hydrolase family protein [Actinomycetospora sp. Odt1-22]MDL5157645.1 cysteine hydrolase family protein [Actinomycetospora sp. Odt1-22]
MTEPSTTLRELTGMPDAPASLTGSALIMIDLQNTYTRGVMALENVEPAIEEAARLLERARAAGSTIVHVQHEAGAGTPYDTNDEIGAIVDAVAPKPGEHRVVKNFPSSFVQTDLEEHLRGAGVTNLVLAGFMTHMCVNSTARSAFNLGFAPTVVAGATATRALPGPGGVVEASSLQSASLAALSDMFAVVVPDASAVPD